MTRPHFIGWRRCRIAPERKRAGERKSEYRTGKFAAIWRNELTAQTFRFSLVLISGRGNDSVDYAFALRPDCTGIIRPEDCFDADKLHRIVDTLSGWPRW